MVSESTGYEIPSNTQTVPEKAEDKLTPEILLTLLSQGDVFVLPNTVGENHLYLTMKTEEMDRYDDVLQCWNDALLSVIIYESKDWNEKKGAELVAFRDVLLAKESDGQHVGESFIFSDKKMYDRDPSFLNLDSYERQEFEKYFRGSNYTVQRKNGDAYKIGLGMLMQAVAVGIIERRANPKYLKTGIDLSEDGQKLWQAVGINAKQGFSGEIFEVDRDVVTRNVETILQEFIDKGIKHIDRSE